MNPTLAKILAALAVVAALVGWASYERIGKLAAQKQVVQLQGDLNLSQERVREVGRGVLALGNATDAAMKRSRALEQERKGKNAVLDRAIALYNERIQNPPEIKECPSGQALKEWREGK